MIKYSEFAPTPNDIRGLGLDERQDWLVAPVIQTRDSGPLERSNFEVVQKSLEEVDSGEDVELHRFGHWGPGWFEILLIRPESPAAEIAESWEAALADYPVADDMHFSEMETAEALEIWQNCYSEQERIKYIRKNRGQFEFRSLTEMMECVRGKSFCGYASELIE